MSKNLINPVENEDFWETRNSKFVKFWPRPALGSRPIPDPAVESINPPPHRQTRFIRKVSEMSKTGLWSITPPLICKRDFWGTTRKWKIYQGYQNHKNVGFNSKTHMGNSPCSNPYKTCPLLRLLSPFLQNGSKKYQESIMFISKGWWCFTTMQNVKKALVLEHFGASRKCNKNTLWNMSFIETFGVIFAKGLSKLSKKELRFSVKVDGVFTIVRNVKQH